MSRTFCSWLAKFFNSFKSQSVFVEDQALEQFTIEFVFLTLAFDTIELPFMLFISLISFRCVFVSCFYHLWWIKVSYIYIYVLSAVSKTYIQVQTKTGCSLSVGYLSASEAYIKWRSINWIAIIIIIIIIIELLLL